MLLKERSVEVLRFFRFGACHREEGRDQDRESGSAILWCYSTSRRFGRTWRRRFKSAALRLLEFLVISFDALIAACDPQSSFRSAAVRRRRDISDRVEDIRANRYIPTRAEPLLPGIEEDDLDSVVADSVNLTSSDSEEEEDPLEGAHSGLG